MKKPINDLKCDVWPRNLMRKQWHKELGIFWTYFKPRTDLGLMLDEAVRYFNSIRWQYYKRYYNSGGTDEIISFYERNIKYLVEHHIDQIIHQADWAAAKVKKLSKHLPMKRLLQAIQTIAKEARDVDDHYRQLPGNCYGHDDWKKEFDTAPGD